jgi:hypothetical protein
MWGKLSKKEKEEEIARYKASLAPSEGAVAADPASGHAEAVSASSPAPVAVLLGKTAPDGGVLRVAARSPPFVSQPFVPAPKKVLLTRALPPPGRSALEGNRRDGIEVGWSAR